MSEKGKGSLLLPLGIGAGLLLLLTSMKKKQPAPAATAPPDPAALLPQGNQGEAAAMQIDPAQAPSYAQAQAQIAPSEEPEQEEPGETTIEDPQESQDAGEESMDEEQEEENSYTPPSGGSSSYKPYTPSSSINTNKQPTPAPAYTSRLQVPAVTSKTKWNTPAKSMRTFSDQAKSRSSSGMRSYSDQAKAARSAGQNNPLIVGNGKPRLKATNNPLVVGNGKPRLSVPAPAVKRPVPQPANNGKAVAKPAAPAKQAAIFPLRFGSTSPYVKEVQRKLGVSATGYFGTLTRAAIQKRFRVSEISEALYKQIITGKIPAAVPVARKPAPVLRKARKLLPKKSKPVKRK